MAGSCTFGQRVAPGTVSPSFGQGKEVAGDCGLPLVRWKRSHGLFVEDKNAGLASKADFLHSTILVEQQRIIVGLGAAVFPAAFGLSNDLPALLHGGSIALDLQAVLAGLQLGFAELCGL